MWIGRPGDSSVIVPVLIAFGVATIGAEFATVFNNAMMPTLVPPGENRTALGNGLGHRLCRRPHQSDSRSWLSRRESRNRKDIARRHTLFGLDAAAHQGDRITGPLTGLWFIIFVLPMFLLTPDHAAKTPALGAVREGLSELRETLLSLPSRPNMATFLIANMVYTDALVALFAFGGIYAAGTFGWQTIQIGSFGILLTISGTLGAWLGGKLDDLLGPKKVITGSMLILLASILLILSIDRDTLFFVIKVAPPVPGGGLFAAPAEKAYLVLGFLIGLAAGPLQAASRTLLIKLAPKERITQYFGLFALSGKVTSFTAPLVVGIVTAITESQKAGMAALVVFFVAGLALLARVKEK